MLSLPVLNGCICTLFGDIEGTGAIGGESGFHTSFVDARERLAGKTTVSMLSSTLNSDRL